MKTSTLIELGRAVVTMALMFLLYFQGAGLWALLVVPFSLFQHLTGYVAGMHRGRALAYEKIEGLKAIAEHMREQVANAFAAIEAEREALAKGGRHE